MKLSGKIVCITGASSGIGEACARQFAEQGAKLILLSRTIANLEKVAQSILKDHDVEILTAELDVKDQEAVADIVGNLPDDWKNIDVLVNNAGKAKGLSDVQDGDIDHWEEMIDTNVKGVLYMSRAILPIMIKNNNGHIIMIGSIAGRGAYPKGGVYCATKAAVKTIADGIRMDTVTYDIKVTDIQPGLVETNFSMVRFNGDSDKAEKVYQGITPLYPEDVADSVVFVATRPKHVQINEILLTPTAQAASTVLHRE